jgi:NADH-quinone oxidoreductase subunit G
LRDNTVVRVRPRPNLDVNRYFICDHGRANYRWMNRGDRVEAPLVRAGGELVATDWDTALDRVRGVVRGANGRAVTIASPLASTEALFLARRLLSRFDWTGAFQMVQGEEAPLAGVPNLALRADRAPNGTGAELLGYTRDIDRVVSAAAEAAVVLVLGEADVPVQTRGVLLYAGAVLPDHARGAEVVLPIANVAEEDGTYVNRDGRVQRYFQAKPAPGMARPAWWVLSELVAGDGGVARAVSAEDVFDLVAGTEPFAGLSYATLGLAGARVRNGAGVPA